MSDIHIDIDDVDNTIPSPDKASQTKQADNIEVEFEESDDRQNRYRFWGWQRLPEMFSDFLSRSNQNFSGFSGRDKPFGRMGLNEVEMRQRVDEMIPEEARQYFRTAQRQFLLGWRALINQQLQKLDAEEELYRARKESSSDADADAGDIPTAGNKSVKIEVVEDDVL
jgi:hypothetical protein